MSPAKQVKNGAGYGDSISMLWLMLLPIMSKNGSEYAHGGFTQVNTFFEFLLTKF
jgi:hypothetical protein